MRALGVVLCLVAILVLAWLVSGPGADTDSVRARAPEPQSEGTARADLVPGSAEQDRAPEARTQVESETTADANEAAEHPPPSTFTFLGHFVLPDRRPLLVPSAEVSLIRDTHVHVGRAVDADQVQMTLPRGRYHVQVVAAGFRHLGREFDFEEANDEESERLVLWPEDWLPVFVRTPDGRPFTALAEDHGWAPKEMFVHAFFVGASAERPGVEDERGGDLDLANWRVAPGYQQVQLPGEAIGSLQVVGTPPFWVSLWVHGRLIDSQVLHPGADEVAFELSFDDLAAGLAEVRARLVDQDSGLPVVDAVAELKADTSAHRRGDLRDVAPDGEGVLVLEHVMPGEHELTIRRGDNLVQERLELAPGERRDLGEIVIGAGPGIPLKVRTPSGDPVFAWVEIAPYERGAYAEDLYPPNLHRTTNQDGEFTLPVPSKPSIVRVRPIEFHGSGISHSPVASANALLDPANLPAELTIVTRERRQVRLVPNSTWTPGHLLAIEDQLGVVLDHANADAGDDLWVEVVEGTYTVRRFDAGTEVGSLVVHVLAETSEVAAP